MTARERIETLFDEGTFVEIGAYAKHRCNDFNMPKREAPYDGVITGYGQVNGRLVYAFSQDQKVLGGSVGEMHANKIINCQKFATKVGAPLIEILDTSGARLEEGIDALAGYGKIFFNNTKVSGVIPTISLIMGDCNGISSFIASLSDFTLMVKNKSRMFLNGKEAIETKSGKSDDLNAIGLDKTHNTKTGLVHIVTDDENDCLQKAKKLLSYLPQNNMEKGEVIDGNDDINRDSVELDGIDYNKAINVKEVINSIADSNDFFELQAEFAKNIVTGFIRLGGKPVGVIANQETEKSGALDSAASNKAARFIRVCDVFNIPILTIVNSDGFIKDAKEENEGLIKHISKLVYSYSEATIPMVTLIVKNAIGGAYVAMGSKTLGADISVAWPNANIAIMSAEGIANIIDTDIDGNANISRDEKIEKYKNKIMKPDFAASRGYIDDIIEPSKTRQKLISYFDAIETKVVNRLNKKHGNMPI